MHKILYVTIICLTFQGCQKKAEKPQLSFKSEDITLVIDQMTDIMVNDITNPPLAARFFSYACLAGYEIVSQNDTSSNKSMFGKLNKYPKIVVPDTIAGYSYQLSALLAMMETAKKIQPSGALMDQYEQRFLDSCKKKGESDVVILHSLKYARFISKAILSYAKADRYNRISNYPRYTPVDKEGCWYPTPPGYFAPVEPFFNTVRPFTLDTCHQFKPAPPAPFSTNKKSEFYKLMDACYKEGVNLTTAHGEIAAFWDCNPFALENNGHLLVSKKKISPGAHWMGITGIACKDAKIPFSQAMKINTVVAIGLMDGFLACWDEKFRSHRVRPESAIRKYRDANWRPLLQTPPFPEYLSGHSTISSASATILTYYFGENFNYSDTVEERFGLPARKFKSFQEAAIEAGFSRFYGGIHFMDAIDNGRIQGLQVGDWVIKKIEKI